MISISLYDALASLPEAARAELIDTLACREEVVDEVMNQVFDGYTSMSSHGPRSFGTTATPYRGIDLARRRIAESSGDIAKKEIADLVEMVRREKERADKAIQELADLEYKFRAFR